MRCLCAPTVLTSTTERVVAVLIHYGSLEIEDLEDVVTFGTNHSVKIKLKSISSYITKHIFSTY